MHAWVCSAPTYSVLAVPWRNTRPWLFGDGIWAQSAACAFRDETSRDSTMDYRWWHCNGWDCCPFAGDIQSSVARNAPPGPRDVCTVAVSHSSQADIWVTAWLLLGVCCQSHLQWFSTVGLASGTWKSCSGISFARYQLYRDKPLDEDDKGPSSVMFSALSWSLTNSGKPFVVNYVECFNKHLWYRHNHFPDLHRIARRHLFGSYCNSEFIECSSRMGKFLSYWS